MTKKLIVLAMTIIMLFSFVGLTSCGNGEDELTGTFYSLQEAYDQGLLTVEDLQSIAYYHNGDSIPMYPHALSAEIELTIKEDHAANLRNRIPSPILNAKAKDVFIDYRGTYNGCVAVIITDIYHDAAAVMRDVYIDGVLIRYSDSNSIVIWKQQ